MRVLIVDDDKGTRKIIKAVLQQHGFSAVEAADPKKAWKIIERHEIPIIISDWVMPEMSGLDFCRRLRRRPGALQPLFFMVTAKRQEWQNYYAARESGVDDFFFKPIDTHALSNQLESARRQVLGRAHHLPRYNMPPLN